MSLMKNTMTALALTLALCGNASADVVQTTAPNGYTNSNGYWDWQLLGNVTLQAGTNEIYKLTSSVNLVDQGWGGEDPGSNRVILSLFNNNTLVWENRVAGAYHSWTTQHYNISDVPGQLGAINAALDAINWASNPTVSMRMYAVPLGYPGWRLITDGATFSVTSGTVPEPGSMALMGAALAGLMFARRKHAK